MIEKRPVLLIAACAMLTAQAPSLDAAREPTLGGVTHVTVRHEKGRYFGWPANGGLWTWGNEILVQYKHGEFLDKPSGSHDINFDKPTTIDQSRSLDGGLTWTHQTTSIVDTENRTAVVEGKALAEPINFLNPDTILKFEWSGFLYLSHDRGAHWRGPFTLPKFDMHS